MSIIRQAIRAVIARRQTPAADIPPLPDDCGLSFTKRFRAAQAKRKRRLTRRIANQDCGGHKQPA